eukprot:6189189-Pleurochrysis_carterae.AAC.2
MNILNIPQLLTSIRSFRRIPCRYGVDGIVEIGVARISQFRNLRRGAESAGLPELIQLNARQSRVSSLDSISNFSVVKTDNGCSKYHAAHYCTHHVHARYYIALSVVCLHINIIISRNTVHVPRTQNNRNASCHVAAEMKAGLSRT